MSTKLKLNPLCVADLMCVDHPQIDPDLSLEDARDRMFVNGVDRLIVVEEGLTLGIVSRRQLDQAEARGLDVREPVRRIMRAPNWLRPLAPAEVAAAAMIERALTSALVLTENEPVGLFVPDDPKNLERARRRAVTQISMGSQPPRLQPQPSSGPPGPAGRSNPTR